MRLSIRRILQVSMGLSALWFFYWLFIYEMVVWRKPYPGPMSLHNVFFLAASLLLFAVFSSSSLFGKINGLLKRERVDEKITLERRAHFEKFVNYMFSRAAYWYWATIFLTAFTALIVLLSTPESIDLMIYIRYILGSIYVLWFPGYTVTRAILPRGELKSIDRIALSLGMSLASVALIGLLLAYTPSGVSTVPVTLSMFALTITSATAAVIREYARVR